MLKNLDKIKDSKVKATIEKMFEHYDVAEMTDERKAWVREKFTIAKDFENLRIVLGIIADEEAGLFIQRDEDAISESERYEFEDRIRKGVKATIKNVVANLYFLTKQDIQDEAIKETLSKQEVESELEELSEEEKAKRELEEKGSGVNT